MWLGAHRRLVAPAWFACFPNCGVVFSPKREETHVRRGKKRSARALSLSLGYPRKDTILWHCSYLTQAATFGALLRAEQPSSSPLTSYWSGSSSCSVDRFWTPLPSLPWCFTSPWVDQSSCSWQAICSPRSFAALCAPLSAILGGLPPFRSIVCWASRWR